MIDLGEDEDELPVVEYTDDYYNIKLIDLHDDNYTDEFEPETNFDQK